MTYAAEEMGGSATLTVSPSSATIAVSETQQFTASYDPDGSGPQASQDVTGSASWDSSNTGIASQTATAGEFIGNADGGPVTITADYNPGTGNLSDTAQLTVGSGTPECSDGIDNDGDGNTDLSDAGCSGPSDDDERDSLGLTQCSDDVDNDGDGDIDFDGPGQKDADCDSLEDNSESGPECSDGIDNDNDGLIDWPKDPQCISNAGTSESGSPIFEEF